MSRIPINISKSKKAEKLITRRWLLEKSFEYLLPLMLIGMFLFIVIMEFYLSLNKNESIGLFLSLLIFTLIFSAFIVYSIFNVYTLKRIRGISRGKNSNLIKKIVKKNNWDMSANDQQISIINFSWRDSGTDCGKQMTILYDRNDILVNCISFGFFSSPSPFHWFANQRKVNKLKTEFESHHHIWENELENWSVMTSFSELKILSKYAGELRFGPAFIRIKTEPENVFGKEFYGDWFFRTKKGVYLQKWNSNPIKNGVHTRANNDLIYYDQLKNKIEVLKTGINSFHWTIEKDENNELTLISGNGKTKNRIKITNTNNV
jgi:hypothetical protein